MHILGRFGNSKFNTLPDIYISKRWTRGARIGFEDLRIARPLRRGEEEVQEALKFYEAVKPPNETPEPVPNSEQEAARDKVVGTGGGGGGIASKFPKKPKPSKNSKRQKAIAEISRMRQRAKYRNLRAKEAAAKEAAEASGREHELAQIFNNDAIHAFTAFVQSQESNNIAKTAI
ncbi:hypothetical protein LINGRAHAP2_LOCUS7973 [Linum grandiflorum]